MKPGLLAFALALVTLGFVMSSQAEAQIRIGIQVLVPPPPVHREIVVPPPCTDAVWVRGYWSWNDYSGRYVWIAGHWEERHPQPVYYEREPKLRHVPNGVAKGWWKKHGRSDDEYYRSHRDDD